MRASTCEVGCAIAECPGLSVQDSYSYYYNYYASHYGVPGSTYLVVCNYGPGYPVENLSYTSLLHLLRPYKAGPTCKFCPEDYPLCDSPLSGQATGEQGIVTGGLCC